MPKSILLVSVIFLVASCNSKSDNLSAFVFPSGGFSYPEFVSIQDSAFYIYQYKDSLSPLDSLDAANFGEHFLSSFDEPNLSIQPGETVVFRFTYQDNSRYPIIINVTPTKIVVKEGKSGWLYPGFDIEKLTIDEKEKLICYEWYLRTGHKKMNNPLLKPYLDSLFDRYPKMGSVEAFVALRKKAEIPKPSKFDYKKSIVHISERQFEELALEISNSGFWRMAKDEWCKNVPMDYTSLTLEVNTPKQYKIVTYPSCPDDTSKLILAFQKIVDLARLNNKIELLWGGSVRSIDIPEVPLN